ncbi:MAG: GspH/FimT family protein [Planctomycetota bacterium]|jgi:prepilin-type N-terminal cleavage/methylation domain-containing protein
MRPSTPAPEPLPSPPARRAGFTILELLIVLALLTITASVGIPAYFARPAVTLDSAARLLAADMREVQNRAALYQLPLHLEFPEDGTGYRGVHSDGDPLHSPYCDGPYVRDYPADAVFEGVRVLSVESPAGRRVSFDGRGLASSTARVVLSFAGDTCTLKVRAGSGLVEIEDLDDPWFDVGL